MRRHPTFLIIVLGFLNALTPFTIDLYLPAFPQIAADFGTSASTIQLSLTTFLIGLAVGQLVIGGHSIGDLGDRDLPFRAADPLPDRGIGDEEDPGDLYGRQPHHGAQGERDGPGDAGVPLLPQALGDGGAEAECGGSAERSRCILPWQDRSGSPA
jgi:hypothetical protein